MINKISKKVLLFLIVTAVFVVGFETRGIIEQYNQEYIAEKELEESESKKIEELEWKVLTLESQNSWFLNRLNELEKDVRR